MNYIEYKEGKLYNPAHLRPFSLELAKQGHPLASLDGHEVSHMFEPIDSFYAIRYWHPCKKYWYIERTNKKDLTVFLRLAPLAVKKDATGKLKPLHVGDVIEIYRIPQDGRKSCKWEKCKAVVAHATILNRKDGALDWRWPAEVKA